MSQADGLTPKFVKVTALGVANPAGNLINTVLVKTQGLTTPVSVFGATNGFAGTFKGMRITSKDNANGTITLKGDNGAVVAAIAKGSQGAVTGTVISTSSAAAAFTNSGTALVVSSADNADVDVEVMFTVTHE